MPSSSETLSVGTANTTTDILDDEVLETRAIQNISGRYIDPTKLKAMLRMIFGVGAYDVYVSCIRANKGLSA
jgi:hypothetical protein